MSDPERDKVGAFTEVAVVYRCWNDGEAAVVVSFLEAHGIPALARTELPYHLFPVNTGKLAEIQITVPSSEAERAAHLLEKLDEGESTEPSQDEIISS